MSRQLIESIVSNNMLEANDMVEAKMAEIRERKMYEMKRMYAANMNETFGALTKADIEARKKAGYKKASEVLGDPREKERNSPRINPGAKILKKKVSEAVDVEPDPEGRVRGGEPKKGKPVKGTFKRKAAAAAIKGVRKTANLAGKAINKSLDVAHGISAARKLSKLRKMRKERDAAKTADAKPSHHKTDTKVKTKEKRPGVLKRLAKKIDDHEPAAPGSGVLKVAKKVADAPIWSDLRSIGTKHL
jgi:hypothetical protein